MVESRSTGNTLCTVNTVCGVAEVSGSLKAGWGTFLSYWKTFMCLPVSYWKTFMGLLASFLMTFPGRALRSETIT